MCVTHHSKGILDSELFPQTLLYLGLMCHNKKQQQSYSDNDIITISNEAINRVMGPAISTLVHWLGSAVLRSPCLAYVLAEAPSMNRTSN